MRAKDATPEEAAVLAKFGFKMQTAYVEVSDSPPYIWIAECKIPHRDTEWEPYGEQFGYTESEAYVTMGKTSQNNPPNVQWRVVKYVRVTA